MKGAIDRERAFRIALVCGTALALQGCVAAAFPIVAGGLMVGEGGTEGDASVEIAEATPAALPTPTPSPAPALSPTPVQPDMAPAASTQSAAIAEEASAGAIPERVDPSAISARSGELETIAPEPATDSPADSSPASTPVQIASSANIAVEAEEAPATASATSRVAAMAEEPEPSTPVTPAPPPAPAATVSAPALATPAVPPQGLRPAPSGGLVPVPNAAPATAGGTFFDPLFSYASAPEFLGSQARSSAMLIDAAALRPDRVECAEGTSTVLIDLDPKGGKLLPIDIGSASEALATRLAELRRKGVAIAWISENSADKEDEIRIALFRSGLDPLGTDELLLMRTPDERKQLRREQLSQTSCLIAIAGDERSDFHELFDYLLNPADARALEPLIGEGWFLIPTPLISERP